jgi:diguanylate cyclase (GGDEF)-like protein/PAS domain S-box-containing protein
MKHWSPDDTSSSAILALIAEYSSDVIAQVRPDMTFSYISPSSERLFRRRTSDVLGHHIAEFVVPEDLPVIAQATRRVTSGAADDAVVTVRVIRGDGTLMWVEVASRLMGGSTPGAPGDRAVIMRDVSDRKALEDDLRAMAMKDGLTGLANRRAFDEVLLSEWKRTVRAKSHMSLLLADIDDFKKFNDAYGHQVGDDCLRSVGLALQSAAQRAGDVVARYGGEEIAIILPASDARAAETVAERARKAVEDLGITHGVAATRAITVSIGVATALARDGGSAEMPQALLSAADRALYMAKAAGRNCCRATLLLATG